jgi:6-phosphogluconolactonase
LKPRILVSSSINSWAPLADETIGQAIKEAVSARGICYVMLTGGTTAQPLYAHWAQISSLPLKSIRFLFGDERCVPPDHADSNYALVMNVLLAKGVSSGYSIARMEADNLDREAAAKSYEGMIPEVIDVLLLGMGTDGHIASLFPHDPALRSKQRKVVPVVGPKPPHERLTITPRVIAQARSVFVLATGAEKGRVLAEALKSREDFISLPVRLTLGGTWILDDEAGSCCLNRNRI